MTWEPKENVANAPEKIAEYYGRIRAMRLLRRGECSALGNGTGILLYWGISDGIQGRGIVR